MPVIQADLAAALKAIFESMPPDPDQCAEAMANAYADYCETAIFGGCFPVITGVHRSALKAVLYAAIADPALGLPNKMSQAWATGVDAFWTAMPVANLTAAGITNGCPGASSLTGTLTAVFGNLANTTETCANGVAAALDTATATVEAHVIPPDDDFPLS